MTPPFGLSTSAIVAIPLPQRSLRSRTLHGLFWTGLAVGGHAAAQLLALLILARLLAPEQFGLFVATMTVAGFATIFADAGLGPALVQRPTVDETHVRVAFTLSLSIGLTIAAVLAASATAIAALLRLPALAPLIVAVAFVVPIQSLAVVAQAMAQRDLRFKWLAGVETTAFAYGYLVVAPFLAMQGAGPWALVWAYIAQQVLRCAMLVLGQAHSMWPMFDRRAAGDLLYFSGGFILARIGNYVGGQGDNMIAARTLGAVGVGLYGHAHQIMVVPPTIVGQILDRVLFPAMARVQHDRCKLRDAYQTGLAVCAVAILPVSLLVIILADDLVMLLLGSKWIGVADPLRVLAVAMLMRTSYKLGDSVARATGAVYARAWRQGLYAAAVLLGAYIGHFWGLRGLAVGVAAAIALNFVLMAHLSIQLVGMTWREFFKAHRPAVLSTAAIAVSALPLSMTLHTHGAHPLTIVLSIVVASAATAALLFTMHAPLFLGPHALLALQAARAELSRRDSPSASGAL